MELLFSYSKCTLYFSRELGALYYVGDYEDFPKAKSIIWEVENKYKNRIQEFNLSYPLSTSSAFNLLGDSRTEFGTRTSDFETRSTLSAPIIEADNSLTHIFPAQLKLPEFSFHSGVYVPNHSLKVDGELSPIYSNVLEKSSSTVNIFSNGELSDYAVILKFKQIKSLLEKEASVTLLGFLFNSCGWYVRYSGKPYSVETAKMVYTQCISDVSFQHRARVPLRLIEQDYINLLIYVAEVSEKSLFDSNST